MNTCYTPPKRPSSFAGRLSLLATLTVLSLSTLVHADTTTVEKAAFTSGESKVSLIELYTSEGCSSCPPADHWLSSLKESDALWNNVVPLAFHVSYWDRLGWPDRFANAAFDTRQRRLAARANAGVYTPGMFRDGEEFRVWRRNPAPSLDRAMQAASERAEPAGLLSLTELSPGEWQLTYESQSHQPTRAYVAALGNDLSNSIRRGENAGRLLEHDFVVMQLEDARLTPEPAAAHKRSATFRIDPRQTTQSAIAAWVVDDRFKPIQAVGGEL